MLLQNKALNLKIGKNTLPNSGLQPARITLNNMFKSVGQEITPQDYKWMSQTKYRGMELFGSDETGDWYLIIPPKPPAIPQNPQQATTQQNQPQAAQQSNSVDSSTAMMDMLKRDPDSVFATKTLLKAIRDNGKLVNSNPLQFAPSIGLNKDHVLKLKALGIFKQTAQGLTVDKDKVIQVSKFVNY
jgi:hypothetical protein